MKNIDEFKKYILLGGGIMAERLYKQLEMPDRKLVGVMDMLDQEKRSKKEFHNFTIQSPDHYMEMLKSEEAALVVAVGAINVDSIIKMYLDKYDMGEENIFVVNPYTSLRFFFVDEELAGEVRIPVSDSRYHEVRDLFKDELSVKIYQALVNSRPYDSKEDTYEVVSYASIKDMYYWDEDYWESYDFSPLPQIDRATVLDCGAYIGDSIISLCKKIPQKDIIYYAFEPDADNVMQMKTNKDFCQCCSRLEIKEYGVGEKDGVLSFKLPADQNKEGGRFFNSEEEGTVKLEIRSLDGLNLDIQGQLYIKMDIEGSELTALKGAKELIKAHKPYLAICLYHRKNDLLEIPLYIKGLLPDTYDFYLRGGYHTILWAIPKRTGENDQF